MSYEIPPISRVEPVSPIAGVRDSDSGLYQLFATQLASAFENQNRPSPTHEAIGAIVLHALYVPPQPRLLSLRKRKMAKKSKQPLTKLDLLFQDLFNE